jgi:hypothetical protein
MTTQLETDALSIDDEVARIGDTGPGFYMINIPKSVPRLKITKACQMEVVILPYKTTCSPRRAPGQLYYFRDYFRHRNLGPAGKDSYFDCAQTFNEKCPIGDALAAAGIKKRAQRMGLMNLLVLTIDGVEVNKAHVLDFSYANFAEQLFEAANQKKKRRGQEHAGFFADPKAGSIIQFDWSEGSYDGSKFYKAGTFDFVPHKGLDGEVAKAMASAVDLDAALNKLPYDEAKARFIDCVPVPQNQTKEDAQARPSRTRQQPEAQTPSGEVEVVNAVPADAPFDAGWE